jgi:hypothetical protein
MNEAVVLPRLARITWQILPQLATDSEPLTRSLTSIVVDAVGELRVALDKDDC